MKTAIRSAAIAAFSLLLLAAGAGAQATTAIDFDKLPRKAIPAPKAGPSATRAKPVPRPVAGQDSAPRTVQAGKPAVLTTNRVDTVFVENMDTLRFQRVDTVRIVTTPVAPPVVPPIVTASGLAQVMLAGGDVTRATYRLRRMELKVTAELGKKAQAIVMIDAAKALSLTTSGTQTSVSQASRMLQDAYITTPIRRLIIDAGQQRLPLGYEGSMGSSGLDVIERALMESDRARGGALGDVRDAGVAVRQAWSAVGYRVGLYNGSGETMNEVDRQVGKTLAGQLSFHPRSMTGIRFGASGVTSGPAAGDKPTRDRVGADLRVLRGPVTLQVEAMTGKDGATRRMGGYALLVVEPRPRFRLVARVDAFDPDRATDSTSSTVAERDYLGGFTWLPADTRLKLQLNVIRKTYSAGLVPSSTLILSQLQASW